MKVCRETNKPIPDFALICPHCKKASCLDSPHAPRVASPAQVPPAKPNPPPPVPVSITPETALGPAVQLVSPASPAIQTPLPPPPPLPVRPPPTPAPPAPVGAAAMSPHLEAELKRLEQHLRVGKRRGWWLGLGTAAAIVLAVIALAGYYASTVWSYAELDEARLRVERDGGDHDRLAIVFQPLTGGRVGFRRADTDRETELLDRVEHGDAAEQRFEWRWKDVRAGDVLRVTHRRGWSLATRELEVPAAPPAPPLGDASLTGEVIDATTGKPVAAAEVRLIGTPLKTKAAADGTFRIAGAPAGAAGVEVTAKNYTTQQLDQELRAATATDLRVVLSPGLAAGQIRIVLEWGKEPQDLDAHLEGPLPDGGQFEISYQHKGDLKSREFVNLDVDAQNGRGPETITVRGVTPGLYHYSVWDWTNKANLKSQALAQSGAVVRLQQAGQEQVFRANQKSDGNLWQVFTIEVTKTGSTVIHHVNQYASKDLSPKVEKVVKKISVPSPVDKPRSLRIAVTHPPFDDGGTTRHGVLDDMGKLLRELGQGYAYDTIELDDLEDAKKLAKFDIVFVTCSSIPRRWLAEASKEKSGRPGFVLYEWNKQVLGRLRENLRRFVEQGGTLYVSDLHLSMLVNAFSEFAEEVPRGEGAKGTVIARVEEKGLRELLGEDIPLQFDLDGWRPAEFKRNKVTVYLSGTFRTVQDKKVTSPLLVKFGLGQGSVTFTSFHNEKINTDTAHKLLRYIVFSVVTARAQAELARKLKEEGLSPEERKLRSTSADAAADTGVYQSTKRGRLVFALAFENLGAELELTVTSPSGAQKTERGTSTFAISIPDAELGEWKYTVKALKVPFPNFAYEMQFGR